MGAGVVQSHDQSQESVASRPGGRWNGLGVAALVLLALAYLVHRPVRALLVRGPEYRAYFSTVGGLRQGDEVRYGGLVVGRVRSVAIDSTDPSRIAVRFKVDRGTPVRTTTRASIVDATNPVTRYLRLRAEPGPAPPLPPGGSLATEVGPTLELTLVHLTRVLQRADTFLAAAAPLADAEFFARLDRATANLDRITTVVARGAGRWGPSLARSAVRLDTMLTVGSHLLSAVDSSAPDLQRAISEMLAALRDTREVVGQLRTGTEQAGGLAPLVRDLVSTTDHLARITERAEHDPLSLVRGRRPLAKPAGPSIHE